MFLCWFTLLALTWNSCIFSEFQWNPVFLLTTLGMNRRTCLNFVRSCLLIMVCSCINRLVYPLMTFQNITDTWQQQTIRKLVWTNNTIIKTEGHFVFVAVHMKAYMTNIMIWNHRLIWLNEIFLLSVNIIMTTLFCVKNYNFYILLKFSFFSSLRWMQKVAVTNLCEIWLNCVYR